MHMSGCASSTHEVLAGLGVQTGPAGAALGGLEVGQRLARRLLAVNAYTRTCTHT